MKVSFQLAAAAVLCWSGSCHAADTSAKANLTVRTLTGRFTGLVNPDYSNVREFRDIPFAQPPIPPLLTNL